MIVNKSSIFNISFKELINELQKFETLQKITDPILQFTLINGDANPDRWPLNKTLEFKLKFLKFFPLGKHSIKLVKTEFLSNNEWKLLSHESGSLTKKWYHTILVEKIDNMNVKYTDIVEIESGLLTFFVWCFANLFYHYRQRNWKRYIKKKIISDNRGKS